MDGLEQGFYIRRADVYLPALLKMAKRYRYRNRRRATGWLIYYSLPRQWPGRDWITSAETITIFMESDCKRPEALNLARRIQRKHSDLDGRVIRLWRH